MRIPGTNLDHDTDFAEKLCVSMRALAISVSLITTRDGDGNL
ncbi:hypothetical protein [Paracoccus sp. IB05]